MQSCTHQTYTYSKIYEIPSIALKKKRAPPIFFLDNWVVSLLESHCIKIRYKVGCCVCAVVWRASFFAKTESHLEGFRRLPPTRHTTSIPDSRKVCCFCSSEEILHVSRICALRCIEPILLQRAAVASCAAPARQCCSAFRK